MFCSFVYGQLLVVIDHEADFSKTPTFRLVDHLPGPSLQQSDPIITTISAFGLAICNRNRISPAPSLPLAVARLLAM